MDDEPRRQPRITAAQKDTLYRLLREGLNIKQAAKTAGVSYSWARAHLNGMPTGSAQFRDAQKAARLGGPVPLGKLNPRARRGLDDFDFFRRTYLGHMPTPWQRDAAERIVTHLASPDKEKVVVNVSPGTGKSTMLHDVACWVTVRNRSIRGLMGAATSPKSNQFLRRLRRSFERVSPVRASAELKERGLACDGEATLAQDYGLFKPPVGGDLWRAEAFVVLQHDDELIEEKESTWSAYGMDQDFLGGRYDIIFWDDLVTKKHIRTLEAVESQRAWWDTEAESRLEPGGALFLVGQRLASNDLYRYCLDKKLLPDDDESLDVLEELDPEDRALALKDATSEYRHIVYKAHDEARCDNQHGKDAPYWPDGCLLDPHRATWKELRAKRANKPEVYATVYQQEDADPEQALVKHVWVTGGTDPDTGTYHGGCWDTDRALCELPKNLVGPKYSIAAVDPSPTKMWAVMWFVYAPEASHQLFLMDTIRRSMPGNELLDWNNNSGEWYGVMQEWQTRSVALDLKITHWVVEINAAQRFLLQYDHVHRWISHHRTSVIPHETSIRKHDETLGVDMTRDWWRFARIRLPGKGLAARTASLKLVEEVQRYPNAFTDDQVMAHWFAIKNLATISAGWDMKEVPCFSRPSWLRAVS